VQISQKNHEFIFGSMFRDDEASSSPPSEYLKIGRYLFDWATVQSYNWKFNRGTLEVSIDFKLNHLGRYTEVGVKRDCRYISVLISAGL
jgi:hypothetical protein